MSTLNRVKNIGLWLILLLITLALITVAWRWGTANLYYKKADYYLKHWHQSAEVNAEHYSEALTAINKALTRHPNHAHYINVRAKIYQWGAYAEPLLSESRLMDARADLLKAAEIRPLWPVTWIDLAQTELDLNNGTANDAFFKYIGQANQTGPYIEEVLTTENTLLTRSWNQLDYPMRQHYFKKVTAMKSKSSLIHHAFNSAETFGQLRVLCSFVRVSPDMSAVRQTNMFTSNCRQS